MTQTIEIPLWLLVVILLFAAVTFASHFLFPSVRWFFRRRLERAVARLNRRLERPIEPFKLARRHDMIQRLIYDPQVSRAVAAHAKEQGIPENVAFQQASSYAREIVPSFSASAYFGVAIRLARLFSNALYTVRLGYEDEGALKDLDPDATVVFVINHRSNMDYVLVTYLAAERSALSYAVGEWARVWPLSGLIRAMGAYFIRRKSRSELYRRVLARYVSLATNGGVTQAMFPEGGLSLDGGLKLPKLGLLKYITDGLEEDGRDVVFVPVALNYDRVLEDRILIAAGDAGERRFRARISVVAQFALKQLWLRVTGQFNRFGHAAVSFGTPLSLREFSAGHKGDLTKELGTKLMKRIGNVVPVLPVPLLAYVLERHGEIDEVHTEIAVAEILQRMKEAEVQLPVGTPAKVVEIGMYHLLKRKIVVETEGMYRVPVDQKSALAYYANSIRHLVPAESNELAALAKENSASAGS
ncbi:MAG: 1-acyl-sn-glycerol-3-phosphate acyltransferase [Paracoccaceae bacterium]